MEEEELLDLISCSSVMSRPLKEYGKQKSTATRTASRLAEFLGPQMVEKKVFFSSFSSFSFFLFFLLLLIKL